MAKLKAVLFDFDNTLVNTDSLKVFRDSRRFSDISEDNLAETVVFKPIRRIIRQLRRKRIKVGVVTNSPRAYVERLLNFHGLAKLMDVVVTYNEVAPRPKPAPDGIELALKSMGITKRHRVIYVGDETCDVEAAYRSGVIPVTPTWAKTQSVRLPPAASLSSAGIVEMAVDVEQKYLFAERCAGRQTTDFDRREARFLPLDNEANVASIRKKLRIICLGRYFSQKSPSTATLHDAHPLTLEIAKKDSVPDYRPPLWMAEMLFRVVKAAGSWVHQDGRPVDVVTVMPTKQGKPRRLEFLLDAMRQIGAELRSPIEFREDLLWFDGDAAPSLRGLGAAERQEQRQFLRARSHDLSGMSVIVVDDVITTGSTMTRALELLEAQGAVAYGLGIAKTVSIHDDVKVCPICGRHMVLPKNRETAERFWSCAGYFENQACTHNEPLAVRPCPLCGKNVRKVKNRRDGSFFYSCDGWKDTPRCPYKRNV